ncbi:MAG TPA: hypothetical protein VJQ06_09880 [Rhizomicrobium sp.]|nr:hypothetical protein [Rhizomicrobium sp.]
MNRHLKLALAFLCLAAPSPCFAQTEAAQPPAFDEYVVAYLFDAPVRIRDYDKGLGPDTFRNMTGPQEDASFIASQRAINGFRRFALPLLAAKLMPGCQIEPTKEDLKAFYPYWRRTLRADIARMPELADLAAFAKSAADDARLERDFGIKQLPQTPLPDMLEVSADTPGADPIARQLIRQWRLYHCVQANYGGDKFFSLWVERDGTGWRAEGAAHCLEGVADGSHGLPTPCLDTAEPIGALGGLFHDAKNKGMLRFAGPGIDQYFFDRYDGDYFSKVKEPEKVKAWLDTPPWLAKE